MTASKKPRIPAVQDHEFTQEQRELLSRYKMPVVINLMRTLLQVPDTLKGFIAWGKNMLTEKNTVPADLRELVILRTGFLCQSEYEWEQHLRVGRQCGLTDEQMQRVKSGPEHADWSPAERAMLRAVDELHATQTLSDEAWEALGTESGFDQRQKMDFVITVGHYVMCAIMLNSFGVELDDFIKKS